MHADRWSIRTKLLLVVFVALLPALLMLFFRGISRQQQAKLLFQRQVLRQVIQLSSHEEQFVHGAQQLLTALAHTPSIENQDSNASEQLLASILQESPQFANILATRTDGWSFASGVPSSPVYYGDRPYFQDAKHRLSFAVGDFVISRSTSRRVLPLAMPVRDRGRHLRSVLIASQNLETLNDLISLQALPTGADVVLLDRQGMVLYQVNSLDAATGQPLLPSEWGLMQQSQGTYSRLDSSRIRRLYAYRKLFLPGEVSPYMVIRLGIPESAALGEIRRGWYSDLSFMGGATLLAMGVAWGLGGLLVRRPVRQLLSITSRIARGDWNAAASMPMGRSEFGRLASSLNELGKALHVREVSRIQSERERLEAEQEQHRLETQMQQAQKLESLGVLSGGIAHDFNNLLTGILGNLDLAKQAAEDRPNVVRFLEKAERISVRATDLTRQLLAYSGRGRSVIRPVDLAVLVREMAQILELGHSKKVHLELQLMAGLPFVQGDAAQLQQVVLNLVTNAAEAIGDQEGRIFLGAEFQTLDEEDIRIHYPGQPLEPGPHVILQVRDTGCGMSEEVQARIFEPFFTTKPSGHGLGLSAMLGILKGHHGGIRILSRQGEGSTFHIALPCAAIPDSQEVCTPGPKAVMLEGRVLLVEDETEIRETMQHALECMGLEVCSASNGLEALAWLDRELDEFDLVVTDLSMPQMDGRELFLRVKGIRPSLPVILCSGHAPEDMVQSLRDQGLAAFLPKPYRAQDLRDAIWKCIAVQA